MLLECSKPIPCYTPLGDGWIWYIKSNGMLENDEYTIILMEGGTIRHFTSDQIKIYANDTYSIQKKDLPF